MKVKFLILAILTSISISSIAQKVKFMGDIHPTSASSPVFWFEHLGYVYFTAEDGTGRNLYRYKTVAEKVANVDIGWYHSYPYRGSFVKFNNKIIFWGKVGNVQAIYQLDENGAVSIIPSDVGNGNNNTGEIAATESLVIFSGIASDNTSHIYKYDGTSIQKIFRTYNIGLVKKFNNKIYVLADSTNNSIADSKLYEMNAATPVPTGYNGSLNQGILTFNNVRRYLVSESTNSIFVIASNTGGNGLYKIYQFKNQVFKNLVIPDQPTGMSDFEVGEVADTNLFVSQISSNLYIVNNGGVKKLAKDSSARNSYSKQQFVKYKNKIYYQGYKASSGAELWAYNMITRKLELINDFLQGPSSGEPRYLTIYNDKLYMEATHNGKRPLVEYDGVNFKYYDGTNAYDEVSSAGEFFAGSTLFFSGYQMNQPSLSVEPYCLDYVITSVANETSSNLNQLYPNPFQDLLKIESEYEINHVALFTFSGQKVLEVNPQSKTVDLNTASLCSGMYYVTITSGKAVENKKVIKM